MIMQCVLHRCPPKMRIKKVDTSSPMVPVVRSASRMEIAELMTVFPNSRVHKSRLPCFRTAAQIIFIATYIAVESAGSQQQWHWIFCL